MTDGVDLFCTLNSHKLCKHPSTSNSGGGGSAIYHNSNHTDVFSRMKPSQAACGGRYLGFVLAVGGEMLQVPVTVWFLDTQQGQGFKSEGSQQSRLVLSRHGLVHLLHGCLGWSQWQQSQTQPWIRVYWLRAGNNHETFSIAAKKVQGTLFFISASA